LIFYLVDKPIDNLPVLKQAKQTKQKKGKSTAITKLRGLYTYTDEEQENLLKNKYQNVKLYLFCNKKNKNTENELWHSVFINDSKKINSKIELFLINAPLDRLKSKEENIQYMLDYFYTSFRKRAIVNSNSSDE
jgi:hypothetical protein